MTDAKPGRRQQFLAAADLGGEPVEQPGGPLLLGAAYHGAAVRQPDQRRQRPRVAVQHVQVHVTGRLTGGDPGRDRAQQGGPPGLRRAADQQVPAALEVERDDALRLLARAGPPRRTRSGRTARARRAARSAAQRNQRRQRVQPGRCRGGRRLVARIASTRAARSVRSAMSARSPSGAAPDGGEPSVGERAGRRPQRRRPRPPAGAPGAQARPRNRPGTGWPPRARYARSRGRGTGGRWRRRPGTPPRPWSRPASSTRKHTRSAMLVRMSSLTTPAGRCVASTRWMPSDRPRAVTSVSRCRKSGICSTRNRNSSTTSTSRGSGPQRLPGRVVVLDVLAPGVEQQPLPVPDLRRQRHQRPPGEVLVQVGQEPRDMRQRRAARERRAALVVDQDEDQGVRGVAQRQRGDQGLQELALARAGGARHQHVRPVAGRCRARTSRRPCARAAPPWSARAAATGRRPARRPAGPCPTDPAAGSSPASRPAGRPEASRIGASARATRSAHVRADRSSLRHPTSRPRSR